LDRKDAVEPSDPRAIQFVPGSTVAVAPDLIVVVPVAFIVATLPSKRDPVTSTSPGPSRTPKLVIVVVPEAVTVTPEPIVRPSDVWIVTLLKETPLAMSK
jgi:hypothetical protein